MTREFAVKKVAADVLAQLERHRQAAVRDEATTAREVAAALEPVRRAYGDSQLPAVYFDGLEGELKSTLPAAWRAIAVPFTELEARRFGSWRGGDLGARLTYVFAGLVLGGLLVWLPFIPIWEKWVPFAMGVGGWWLPDAQAAWHRRRYGRELGEIARRAAAAQPALEARVSMSELLPPDSGS